MLWYDPPDNRNEQEEMTMEQTAGKLRAGDLTYIGIFAALMAVCAWISIPAAVPFTLQTLGVFLAVGLLGGRRGTLAVLVYILLAAVGVPVLAGFQGGVGALLGNTGGYVLGFLLSALAMWAVERLWGRSVWALGAGMLLGLVLCYAFGTAWFFYLYTRSTGPVALQVVLGWCVVPFLIPDLCKIAAALLLTRRLGRHIK